MKQSTNVVSGFSLVELAILLIVVGLSVATAVELYMQGHRLRYITDTGYRGEVIQAALDKFVAENGRLPCPSKPALPRGHAQAGVEQCLTGLALGTSVDGFWRVAGYRDTDADAETALVDNVYIGSIPFVTLNIPVTASLDGWGNKFRYAVSQYMTDTATYKETRGVIDIKIYDSGLGQVSISPEINGIATLYSTPFIVLSHGDNGVGGYNINGKMPKPCSGSDAGVDLGNCDGDARFYNYGAAFSSFVEGANYSDDRVIATQNITRVDRWGYGDIATRSIFNTANSRVGIGTDAPADTLDVNGNIRVQQMTGATYCNTGGINCFPATIIAGAGINCGNGAVSGVRNAKTVCVAAVNPAGLTPATCPGGQYVKGFDSAGNIICATP